MGSHLEQLVLAVDVVLLRPDDEGLAVLLASRDEEPFRGVAALPGVALEPDETLAHAARRALASKAGLAEGVEMHLEQLRVFDDLYRDPRGRTVSVAFLGTLSAAPEVAGEHAQWVSLEHLDRGTLPFDHGAILDEALQRLVGKLRYTDLARTLLPERFTFDSLMGLYEVALGEPLNRANFRMKLLKLGLIERAGILDDAVGPRGGRPPHLYRFVARDPRSVPHDFV